MREQQLEANLCGDAEGLEPSGAQRRDVASESRGCESAESKQRETAERDGRAHKEDDHCEVGSGAASGAVRHSLELASRYPLEENWGGTGMARPSYIGCNPRGT